MNLTRYFAFVGVGALAAAVHFTAAVILVSQVKWLPLYANIGGYVIALVVSFVGQSRLTFHTVGGSREFIKFFAVSLTGFILNTALYASLLQWTTLDYRVALILVLAAVAFITYLLMSRWVFLQQRRIA